MMWTYEQHSGKMLQNGVLMGIGYSGIGEGLNNPAMEADHDVGPIPRGLWSMGAWHDHPHLGPCVSLLSPVGHDAHGRTEIFIHGDNAAHNHTASHGCIILGPSYRHIMRDSNDTSLTVTE